MSKSKLTDLYPVTFKVTEAKRLLKGADIRKKFELVEVFIEGKWRHLCRTDLKDDVCTYGDEDIDDLESTRCEHIENIVYGARMDSERFAVVDAISDG